MFDKDLDLIYIRYEDNKWYHLTDYCSKIEMLMSYKKISTELNFIIPCGLYSPSIPHLRISKGDRVQLKYHDKMIFSGKVITNDLDGKKEEINVKCYDYCWWFCKSNITKNFSNITALEAIKWVYRNIGMIMTVDEAAELEYQLGDNANLMLDTHLIENQPANKVLSAIYNDIRKKTNVYYYMHTDEKGERVVITESDRYYSGLSITACSSKKHADGNLISYSISESMEDMITRYRVYKENAQPVNMMDGTDVIMDKDNPELYEVEELKNSVILNQEDVYKYGVIQETITMDDGDSVEGIREKCKNEMSKHNGESILNVICFGDLDYKPAYGVLVKIPDTEFYDVFMYITTSRWTWLKDGHFTNTMELQKSKHMDMTSWDEIENKQESSNKSNDTNAKGAKAIEDAVTWAINIANDDNHGYSQANRWGEPDYDCSSFVISAFEQAGVPLKSSGATYTGNMYDVCISCGFEDVTGYCNLSNGDNVQRGDILLNKATHVALSIGNDKIVHASSDRGHPEAGDQTGTEIYIADYYNKPWDCVLRLKVTSNAEDANGLVSSQYIEVLKLEEGFVKHWDNSSTGGAIGYGTDASSTVGKRLKAQGVTTCTEEEATEWLKEEVNEWAEAVQNKLTEKNASLNQYFFDVMTDVCYQWGNRQWELLDILLSGDIAAAKSKIMSMGNYTIRNKTRCNILDGRYEYAG